MNQKKLTYIHYYILAIATSILVWGGFEYVAICNGHNCMIDTSRLWTGLALITLIFIPITLCVWSEYVNGQLQNIFGRIKLLYEEKTLIFAIAIFISLSIASLMIFNAWWAHFVKDNSPKEYMAALVNLSVFVATLFAPIAALILYDNWKIQHNKTLLSEEAKSVYYVLHKERICFYELREFIIKRAKINKDKRIVDDPMFTRNLETIADIFNSNRAKLGEFTILAEDQNFHIFIEKYRESFKELVKLKESFDFSGRNYVQTEVEILELIELIKTKNYDCITEVKTYIFMK